MRNWATQRTPLWKYTQWSRIKSLGFYRIMIGHDEMKSIYTPKPLKGIPLRVKSRIGIERKCARRGSIEPPRRPSFIRMDGKFRTERHLYGFTSGPTQHRYKSARRLK